MTTAIGGGGISPARIARTESRPAIWAPAAAETVGSCQVMIRELLVSGEVSANASAASVALLTPGSGTTLNPAPGGDGRAFARPWPARSGPGSGGRRGSP